MNNQASSSAAAAVVPARKRKIKVLENKLVRAASTPAPASRKRSKNKLPVPDVIYVSSEEEEEARRDILEAAMEGLFSSPEPAPLQQQSLGLFTSSEPSQQQQPQLLSMEEEALEELLRYAETSPVTMEGIAAVLGTADATARPSPSPNASVADSDATEVDEAFTVEARGQSPAIELAPTSPDAQANWWVDEYGDWDRNFNEQCVMEHQVLQRLEDQVQPASLESQPSPSQIPCGQRSPVQPEPQVAWWDDDSGAWDAVKLDEDAPVPLRSREIINGYADVHRDFKLPAYSSRNDRHDRLLCAQFINLDAERAKFVVVGLDPLRNLSLCLRLVNTRTRESCRFAKVEDVFTVTERYKGKAGKYRFEGVTWTGDASGVYKIARQGGSITLAAGEVDNILAASSFIQARCQHIRDEYEYAGVHYLTWIQELAVKMIVDGREACAIREAIYEKLLKERTPRQCVLIMEIHIYYNNMFVYHSTYVLDFMRKNNKFVI